MKEKNKNEVVEIDQEYIDQNFWINKEYLEENISDAISDITGFCHNGFRYKIVVTTELDKSE